MRLVIAAALVAACGHKASDDCAIVRDDAEHAMERIAREYQGDPVKASEVIERCIAPSGDECDRVEKIAKAIPKMIGSAALSGSGYAAACRTAPPELKPCLLPSYLLGHSEECMAALKKPIELTIKPGEHAPPPSVDDCGVVDVEMTDTGIWLATSKDGRCFAPKKDDYDWAWLEDELKAVHAKFDCGPSLELAATPGVKYDDVIHAMDISVKVGLLNVGLAQPEELVVQFSGTAPRVCPAPTLIKVPPAELTAAPPPKLPRSGTDTLAQAPVIIVTKDAIMFDGKLVVTLGQANAGGGVLDELAKAMPVSQRGVVILQADKDTPSNVVNRIVATTKSRGYDNVLFAVKKK